MISWKQAKLLARITVVPSKVLNGDCTMVDERVISSVKSSYEHDVDGTRGRG